MKQVREPLFAGALPGPSRKFLASALAELRAEHDTLLIPAVDQFDIVRLAIAAGWQPRDIWASDIGLVPRLLGALADPRAPWPEFTVDDAWPHGAHGPYGVAQAMWLIRRTQMAASGYQAARVRHLDEHQDEHIARLATQLEALTIPLAGVNFTPTDLREVVLTAGARTAVIVDPPSSSDAFKRDHAFGSALEYEPPAPGFVWHREQADLYASARGTGSTQLWSANLRTAALFEPDVVFAIERKPAQVDFWLSTKPRAVTRGLVSFSRPETGPIDAPIFGPDDRITAESTVAWIPATPGTIAHYRGLWAHRIPATSGAEVYLLLLVDGKVFGIAMFRMNAVASLQTDYAELISGFTAPHPLYKRGSRLLMLLVTSREFAPVLAARQSINRIFRIAGITTTALSKFRKTKALNGIAEVFERTKQPDGSYKIRYRAEFRDDTAADVLARFVREEEAFGAR